MALGESNYQVTRWATSPGNEAAGCTAIKNFLQSPGKTDYSSGYMGKIIFDRGLASDATPKPDGITVAMTVTYPATPGCPATWPADPNLPSSDDAQCTIALNYNPRIPFPPSKTLPLTAAARMLVSQ